MLDANPSIVHMKIKGSQITFGANIKNLSGNNASDGFAPTHRILSFDNDRNETSRTSIICFK